VSACSAGRSATTRSPGGSTGAPNVPIAVRGAGRRAGLAAAAGFAAAAFLSTLTAG
jgi:hypothetical protein